MMHAAAVDTPDPIARLDAVLAAGRLRSSDADRCADLLQALRRPARVCLLGTDRAAIATVFDALFGDGLFDAAALPAAVEFVHGDLPRVQARLEDGSSLSHAAWPAEDILRQDPVFLQVFLPVDRLREMSVLTLALDDHPASFGPAMTWAAGRSEIAVWCSAGFDEAETRIWAAAPDRLTDHAFLVRTRPHPEARAGQIAAGFIEVFQAAGSDAAAGCAVPEVAGRLLARLTAMIDEARAADLDLAQLFLHRVAPLDDAPDDTGEPARSAAEAAPDTRALQDLRSLLSEPLLYLMRRARALAERLVWVDESEDWQSEAVAHCCETIEALRDRASAWPAEHAQATHLQRLIEMACDTTTLLQIEDGPETAEDAATILMQLRLAFVQALAAEPVTTGFDADR